MENIILGFPEPKSLVDMAEAPPGLVLLTRSEMVVTSTGELLILEKPIRLETAIEKRTVRLQVSEECIHALTGLNKELAPVMGNISQHNLGRGIKKSVVDYAREHALTLLGLGVILADQSSGYSGDGLQEACRHGLFEPTVGLVMTNVITALDSTEISNIEAAFITSILMVQLSIERILPIALEKREQSQAGKDKNQIYRDAEDFCILKVKELWERRPQWRFVDVERELQNQVRDKFCIEVSTNKIRKWLKARSKAGKLDIPATASNPGRKRGKTTLK